MEKTKWPDDARSMKKHPTGGGDSATEMGLTELKQLDKGDRDVSKPMDVMGAPVCNKTKLPTKVRGKTFTIG